jgi:hypothetical protein
MNAGIMKILLWGSLAFSIILAGFVAFPTNRWLIARGKGHSLVRNHNGPHPEENIRKKTRFRGFPGNT